MFMSGIHGAPCTAELKKKARQEWENENPSDWLVLGFTADERPRHERFSINEREEIIPILIDLNLTKNDCFRILLDAGLELPATYLNGLPNANCLGCCKATSATYWSLIREKYPDVFAARAEQSRRIGAKLVRLNGTRIFLDELPKGATGRPLATMNFECGLFCEDGK